MDWQTVIAAVIVAAAVGVLGRQVLQFTRGAKQGGCGSCPSKPVGSGVKSLPLVQLRAPSQPKT